MLGKMYIPIGPSNGFRDRTSSCMRLMNAYQVFNAYAYHADSRVVRALVGTDRGSLAKSHPYMIFRYFSADARADEAIDSFAHQKWRTEGRDTDERSTLMKTEGKNVHLLTH